MPTIHQLSRWFAGCMLVVIVGCGLLPQTSAAQSTDYPIVDTGQTTCYNDSTAIACPAEGEAFSGQDAQVRGNPPDYTNHGDGAVSDNVTGLMWQQSPDTDGDGDIDSRDTLSYNDAMSYCADLTLAGYDDWRLPDIKQLYSLIDFTGTDPLPEAIDATGLVPFINTDSFAFAYGDTSMGQRIIDAQYASSTLYVSTVSPGQRETQAMFGVNFADGRIKGYPANGTESEVRFRVLCVRGNSSYGQNAFVDNGNGTITDAATGLMWAHEDSAAGLTWEAALAYVAEQNAANYLGYSDWRLPNAKELQSVVDYTRSPDTSNSAAIDPLFDASSIINEGGEADYPAYWSSTTHVRWNGTATSGIYVAFGRALGYINGSYVDVHGAGAQRSDPKAGDPADLPSGSAPQGDVRRIFNYVRLVRDTEIASSVEVTHYRYIPVLLR